FQSHPLPRAASSESFTPGWISQAPLHGMQRVGRAPWIAWGLCCNKNVEDSPMNKRYILAVLAYLVPTFALGFVWHLVLFKEYYESLAIYREQVVIPLGFLSMLIQSLLFAWVYDRTFSKSSFTTASLVLQYLLLGAMLSWSFTTLAVGAKNLMAS